MERANDDF
jgi:hypothetical protein